MQPEKTRDEIETHSAPAGTDSTRSPFWAREGFEIHLGDCLQIMRTLPTASVHCVVTDPPYGISFMGREWDHGIPGAEFWAESLRVAKPGAMLMAFGGTRTFHRLACAIEDAGWEMRDCLNWIHGNGFPKSHNLRGDWAGYGTALKPAWEPILLAMAPLDGTFAQNAERHGVAGLHIDAARVPFISDADRLSATAKNQHSDFGTGPRSGLVYGQYSRDRDNWNPNGRWPANVVHDGSDEVQTSLGAAARFFYCGKAETADREEGCEHLPETRRTDGRATDHAVPNLRTAPRRNHHPTVKPSALMRWLVRLACPTGGTILDPFMGSGSTGKAAALEGFRFTGIDIEPDHCAIAQARIAHALGRIGKLE